MFSHNSFMSLFRRKPFALLAALPAVTLLYLAYTTKQNECYQQVDSLGYAKIDDNVSTYCSEQCYDDVASKKIAYIQGDIARTESIPGALYAPDTPGLKIIVKCSWSLTTVGLFLVCAFSMVAWITLELLLAAKRKYPFLLNTLLILLIGLGIPTAIYQFSDIQNRTCSDITTPITFVSQDTLCYQLLNNGSFILTVVVMHLLLFQLFYNIVRRRAINEENHPYADIPQAPGPALDNVVFIAKPLE